ncbi:MAG: DHHA1 domain-containing protein [Anaerolineae bacterium]|nr:DHHA1 domain-containing protein [Anaerolineae bacterium]
MTVKLYYDDPKLLKFTAKVIAEIPANDGTAVCLDRSAFYPTSGGQPHDTGTLNHVPVTDVWEAEDGHVWHLLPHALETHTANGQVEETRRIDHIQQHTGQHLLSACFFRQCQANTIGFHLGSETSTIDLDVTDVSWETVFSVEEQVNAVIRENKAVSILYRTDENIDQIALRKPAQVSGAIRIIQINDFDASACGGTHAEFTGEIGLLKVTGIEHYKGGVRVSFLAGRRALLDYQQSLRGLQLTAESLSVARHEVVEVVHQLQETLAGLKKAYNKARADLLEIESESLWFDTPEKNGVRYVTGHWADYTYADIRQIANQLRARSRTVVLLAATDEKGVRLICSRSDDVPQFDARAILNLALKKLGGRGGGSSVLAQGGSPTHARQEILTVLDTTTEIFHNQHGG